MVTRFLIEKPGNGEVVAPSREGVVLKMLRRKKVIIQCTAEREIIRVGGPFHLAVAERKNCTSYFRP